MSADKNTTSEAKKGRLPHPNPNFPLLARELETAMGSEWCDAYYEMRACAIANEEGDPYRHGFRPAIWHLADDLLCDGKSIKLVDYPGILPQDFQSAEKSGQLEIIGRRELFISGSIRSSKSHYGARKCLEIEFSIDDARGWSFHESDKESIARQQPLFWHYMLPELKNEQSGRFKQGPITNIAWTQKNGFPESSFVLPNKSQHWFRNYEQGVEKLEGESLNVAWLDERAPVPFLKTIRYRLLDRKGILIVTFTPINDGFTEVYSEYDQGSETLLEVEAKSPPVKLPSKEGNEIRYRKVPRIKKAGPGSDGNVKANTVYFHIPDNPYFDKENLFDQLKGGKEEIILARAYGLAQRAALNQFNFVESAHKLSTQKFRELMESVKSKVTRYMVVDPCSGRNWFMLWILFWAPKRGIIYREWPSFGHPGAYIDGIGDPGPWAVPGTRTIGGRPAADGVPGEAQRPMRFGIDRYMEEISKAEGKSFRCYSGSEFNESEGERIRTRLMDCSAANSPSTMREGAVTLIEQCYDAGISFVPAARDKQILNSNDPDGSIEMINRALGYDEKTPLGEFSAARGRINESDLMVLETCPNVIYSLTNWTGKDGGHGASKDPVDAIRMVYKMDLDYEDEQMFRPKLHAHFQRR